VVGGVASALGAELDILLVRRLAVPGQEELALGAIAAGGVVVLNDELIDQLGIGAELVAVCAADAREELERRERAYRGCRPQAVMRARTLLLIDDGLATGATMRAAVRAAREQAPSRVVVATPVASVSACSLLEAEADEVVCAQCPEPFWAVGVWYDDFEQTTDEEVGALLARGWERPVSAAQGRGAPPISSVRPSWGGR
jgi:putative phosphoribosyl transferase